MKRLILTLLLVVFSASYDACAERIKILDSDAEALQARFDLISEAREEIFISYFIFNKDDTSKKVLALLRQKAREGVKVKVLIDGMFNSIPKYMGTHLVKEGVEIKNYNNFNIFRLGHIIKYRMHDKMIVVDGKHLILGGRNIEDTYYGFAPKNYKDRDVYIEGTIAPEAREYYLRLWEKGNVKKFKVKKKLHRKRRKKKFKKAVAELDKHYNEIVEKGTGYTQVDWKSGVIESDQIEFAHDFVAYRKKRVTGTAEKLYELIRNAKHTVLIDSPYFILTKEMKKLFKEVIDRDVKVRVLTNSLKATDGIVPQAAYIGQRKKIVKMGIELYEYYDNDCFHSKSMVVDGEIAAIGSFNFDPRSQNLNTETMAIIDDATVAGLLVDSMAETLVDAQKINEKGRPEGQKKRLPGVKFGKKVLTRLIQYLVVPWAKPLL